MTKIKGIGLLIISVGLLYIVGLLTYGLIRSEYSSNPDFVTSGTAINKAIVWILLISTVLISGIVRGFQLIIKQKIDYKTLIDNLDAANFDLKIDFKLTELFKISILKIFSEPIFYLFAGFIVLPQFQEKSFIEPLNIINILILTILIIIVNLILSLIHLYINLTFILNGTKTIRYIIKSNGIEIETSSNKINYNWTDLKCINKSKSLFTLKVNWFHEFYLPKKYIDRKEQQILNKIKKYNVC